MKNILMVVFHYPPYSGGSGIHRALKFSRYLPEHGWQPLILTAAPRAYPQVGNDQMAEIPRGVRVKRSFALDAARHLSIGGRYLKCMALPDRWVNWWLSAVPVGLGLIRRHRPEIIWSTHPIATAHLIGLTLCRLTGIPWVSDFRDSMIDATDPRDPLTRRAYEWIERRAVRHSARLIFTTRSARQMYLDRYGELSGERCAVISNGYDEEDFRDLNLVRTAVKPNGGPVRLVHAGLIYPDERNPQQLFRALARLKREQGIGAGDVRVELRASGSEAYYAALIQGLGIGDVVRLLPPLPYRAALEDCSDADGLLLFQAASCNHLIPAKAYEYVRLRKPILALTAEEGDTAALLRETGGATIIDLADEGAIYRGLPQFLHSVRHGGHPLPDSDTVQRYARRNQVREFAECLVAVTRSANSGLGA